MIINQMELPPPLHHIQVVPARKGAQTSLSFCSEPPLRSVTKVDMAPSTRTKSYSAVLPQLTTSPLSMSSASLGVNARRSGIRSLANNPNFTAEIIKGELTFQRRKHTLSVDQYRGISPNVNDTETHVAVSKNGYHPRSRSPTYQTLVLAKSQLEILLSRKLCEIRRNLDGQKARQNSAAFSDVTMTHETDDLWYVSAINEEDEETSAIETTRLVNEDYASSFETISTAGSLPHRSVRFTSKVLKENIANKAILELDVKGEENKIREWRTKNATDIPRLERPDSAAGYRRNCLAIPRSAEEKHTFMRRTSRPIDPAFIAPLKRKTRRKNLTTVKEVKETPRPTVVVPEPVKQETEAPKEVDKKEPEPEVQIEEEKRERKSLSYVDRHRDDEDNIKPIPAPQMDTISETDSDRTKRLLQPTKNQLEKPIINSIDPLPMAENTDNDISEQGKSELTAKEKFLRMQQRMEQRKLTKQKTRESFAEYSYMMFSKNRDKGNVNKLGETLSKRLENMTTFKSTMEYDSDDETDYEDQLNLLESDDD